MDWVPYSGILDLMLQFSTNSITLLEQGVANDKQINCFKAFKTITFVNVDASLSSGIKSQSHLQIHQN